MWVSANPREEFPVGWKAEGALLGHRLAPGLTQRIAEAVMQRTQAEDAPPAPRTSGSVHAPRPTSTAVDWGARARWAREDEAAAAAAAVATERR